MLIVYTITVSFIFIATLVIPIDSFSTTASLSRLYTFTSICPSSTTTSLYGYLDSLSSPTPESEDGNKIRPQSNFQPKKASSSSGGGIPCGRGPLGSYLDAMTGSSSTSNNKNEYPTNFNKNRKENFDDEEDFFQKTKKKKNNRASGSGAYLGQFLDSPLNQKTFLLDDARTDIRNLLTQRSIQSFMRLCEECRDPHSAKWIQEDFLQQKGNLLGYHGTGAKFIEDFGGRWDAPLLELTQQNPTTIVISSKRRGRGHGGWSPHNPYLKERWVETTVTIDPTNLATRILSVREQIAKEWVEDLNVLIEANEEILNSFYEGTQDMKETQERKAAYLVSNNSRFAAKLSSPYRRSNFDLLYNLCTQAAIHRILRDFQHTNDLSFYFLKDFYTNTAAKYFDGELEFGRADDFMEALLNIPPSITPDGTITRNPLLLAELIIQKRRVVAEDWKQLMARVQQDHTGIRQLLFNNQFQTSPRMDNFGDDLDSLSFQ